MGVDYSVTIGYGFPVKREMLSSVFTEDLAEYGLGELMENLFYMREGQFRAAGLGMATIGSYYEYGDDAVMHFVVVPRLTKTFDAYDAPGGEFVIDNADVTDEEYEKLRDAWDYLTDGAEGFNPRSFAGGLWH